MQHFPGVEDPAQLCMVGDRLLTDVVFGNLHGMLTVHILPLCTGKENKNDNTVAKVVRTVENKIMYADWWVGRKVCSYLYAILYHSFIYYCLQYESLALIFSTFSCTIIQQKIRSYTLDHKVWKGEDECPLVLADENEPMLGKLDDPLLGKSKPKEKD